MITFIFSLIISATNIMPSCRAETTVKTGSGCLLCALPLTDHEQFSNTRWETLFTVKSTSSVTADKVQAYKELAVLASAHGKPEQALELWNKVLGLAPNDQFASLEKAWTLLTMQKYKEADRMFHTTMGVASDPAILSDTKLGMALCAKARNDEETAMPMLIALYSKNPFVISFTAQMMGEMMLRDGRYAAAMTYFGQAVEHDPRNYTASLRVTEIFERERNYIQAWQGYAALAALDPDDEVFQDKLENLAKHLKGDPIKYLYYTRLGNMLQISTRTTPSMEIRVGMFSDNSMKAGYIQSFDFIASSSFTVTDSQLGPIAYGKPARSWTLSLNKETNSVDIKDQWGNLEFTSSRPFSLIPMIKGASIAVRNARALTIFGRDYGDREMLGSLTVYPSTAGMILVNTLPSEDYLPGAVASIKTADMDGEALKALAVIVRTKLLRDIAKKHPEALYDICDSDKGIAYKGINKESNAAVTAATSTHGEILMSSGTPAELGVHEVCGGISEDGISDVPGIDAPKDPVTPAELLYRVTAFPETGLLCAPQDPTRWSAATWFFTVNVKDIARRVSRIKDIGRITNIEITSRSRYGRASMMRISGTKDDLLLTDRDQIMMVLTAGAARSALFHMTTFFRSGRPDWLLLRGIGTGSGDGLCLQGAQGMADQGKNYREILSHYFPDYSITDTETLHGPEYSHTNHSGEQAGK